MNEIERVKEKALLTDEEILSVSSVSVDGCQSFKEAALRMYHAVCQAQLSKVLATEGVLVKSDNNYLPAVPEEARDGVGSYRAIKGEPLEQIWVAAQQDMLKARFVRVVKEERKE